MAEISRRNMLLGMATLVFGGSGFIASGAFEIGSDGEQERDEWIRVASAEIVEEDDDDDIEIDDDDTEDDEDDEADDDPDPDPVDDEDPDPDPDRPTSQVEIVHDRSNPGTAFYQQGTRSYTASPTDSDFIESDSDGYFERFSVANANRNAVSWIGAVDEDGYPTDPVAFYIVNVGFVEQADESPREGTPAGNPVEVQMDLVDGRGTSIGASDQLRFPYRAARAQGRRFDSGRNLVGESVRLHVGEFIEVVIEIDARNGTDDIERVQTLQFSVSGD